MRTTEARAGTAAGSLAAGLTWGAAAAGAAFSEVSDIIMRRCQGWVGSPCHGQPPLFAANLDLRAGYAYASLVNAASSESTLLRVKPEHPELSFLMMKLTNAQPAGAGKPMPQFEGGGWMPLRDSDIQLFNRWIRAGAKNDADR